MEIEPEIIQETINVLQNINFKKSIKKIWKGFREHLELPGERKALLRSLFHFEHSDDYFIPASDWKPAPGQSDAPIVQCGYPHDMQALFAFSPIIDCKVIQQEDLLFFCKVSELSNFVCSGSPKANKFSRDYLPSIEYDQEGNEKKIPTLIKHGTLPYVFVEDLTRPKVKVCSKMDIGKVSTKTRKAILDCSGTRPLPWFPKNYNDSEWLKSDFLLVSRLPRTIAGGDILLLSGGHGAGTEAISHLFSTNGIHINELKDLVNAIGGSRYYQFVLEVTEVEHAESGTIPKKVELAKQLPPVQLSFDASVLKTNSNYWCIE